MTSSIEPMDFHKLYGLVNQFLRELFCTADGFHQRKPLIVLGHRFGKLYLPLNRFTQPPGKVGILLIVGSLLRRGPRAHCALYPICGVIRVAGYSVVWDCDPTSIFPLKSTKKSAAAILGRSAPSLLFMVRFGIFCCRQDFLLCFT